MQSAVDPLAVQHFIQFRDLSLEEATDAAAALQPVHLSPGESIFRQGTCGDAAYLLRSGRVEIKIAISKYQERVLATLLPGAIFGEVSLLSDEPRTATAVARAETDLWLVDRTKFDEARARRETWSIRLLEAMAEVLCRRLSSVDQELVALIAHNSRSVSPGDLQRAAELQTLHDRLFGNIASEDSTFSYTPAR
jgi:CRP/FNR family transcriptional regulator, cyclic AMP receptor protein